MSKPYVYLSTGVSRDVTRNAPDGARAAIHFPDLNRTVELSAHPGGSWSVLMMPAPGGDGPRTLAAYGSLHDPAPDQTALRSAFIRASKLADGEAVDACAILLGAVAAYLGEPTPDALMSCLTCGEADPSQCECPTHPAGWRGRPSKDAA